MTASVCMTKGSEEQKKHGMFLFHLCPCPSVPWSEQQTLTAGRRRGIWGRNDLLLAWGLIESCQQWGTRTRYRDEYATRTFFFILLILVITGSSRCPFSHLYPQHHLQVDGAIEYYRMVRRMTELQYTREWSYIYSLNMNFSLPPPGEKYLRNSVLMANV